MAQSQAHGSAALGEKTQAWLASGERRLRHISSWLMLFFLLQGELGAVWDREWHAYVGRDQFWTPPHTLIYTCVAGVGLLALALVLTDTIRYRRQTAGVNDASTISIFAIFHAPLGFTITGFGALLALVAAPLDNYWHELYGIDIALWAPFHMMGVTGGMIGILGMVYVFASEAAIERSSGRPLHRFLGLTALEFGAVLVLASLLDFTLTGFLQFPIVSVGPMHIDTYPLPLIAGAALAFVGAIRLTRRPGVATLITIFLLAHTLIVEFFIPWAINTAVAQQGLDYRIPGHVPSFSPSYAFLPLALLISSLVVDGVAYWRLRRGGSLDMSTWQVGLLGLIVTPPIFLLAPYVLQSYSPFASIFLPEPGIAITPALSVTTYILAVIVMLLMGAGGAILGAEFGDIWRWSRR